MEWICGSTNRDVPLFVEHCEAVAAEIDVKLRWLGALRPGSDPRPCECRRSG